MEKGLVEYAHFGAVNNRRNRADVFLPYDSAIVQSLFEVTKNVYPLLNELKGCETGMLHELSSFVSDPEVPISVSIVHPYLPNVAPLYILRCLTRCR